MEGREVEIPQYFLCPISLQIMKDPVTTVTGITYERESIEKWLSRSSSSGGGAAACPVTNQPLSRPSGLTPNHTLRRLIQAWCVSNATSGVDQIPTPKPPLDRARVLKLMNELASERSMLKAMKKLEELAEESEQNRACMVEAGAPNAMVGVMLKCFKQSNTTCLDEALRILDSIWSPTTELKNLVKENYDFVDSLAWALHVQTGYAGIQLKTHALAIMKKVTDIANVSLLERLKLDLFESLVKIMRDTRMSQQGIKTALLVLIDACHWGRNRFKMVEAGVVFELVELELRKPEKRISELAFNLLAQLCSCADGRAQLLRHAGGVAMVAKRTLRVSPAVDDKALQVLTLVSKFSATGEVVSEMLRVGAVSKLCMVLQADCAAYLKSKARAVLRMHANVWNNSPCIQVYLLTRIRHAPKKQPNRSSCHRGQTTSDQEICTTLDGRMLGWPAIAKEWLSRRTAGLEARTATATATAESRHHRKEFRFHGSISMDHDEPSLIPPLASPQHGPKETTQNWL